MDKKYLDLIALVPTAARLIGTVAEISGLNQHVTKLSNLLADTVESVNIPEAVQELHKLTSLIQLMVDETREPTEDEWANLQRRSDIAHDAIQSVNLDDEG